ncbi:arginine--tRNA ligase [Patescibacteria group bacterium]|nr:arginine--tRNA ligase [Patescibacteria group bacterium]MCL5091648.1 arginine--tRNA ligase [Patescibacteria group bacterium]
MIDPIIKDLIAAGLKKLKVKTAEISVETPANPAYGDYASSVALKLAKTLKKNPLAIAQEIVNNLPASPVIAKAEAVKPGFINFWVKKNQLFDSLENAAAGRFIFPRLRLGPKGKVMIEFAHPNTHKLFHIGHLRNISTGESVARLLEAGGNQVIRSNYQGDVGLHIAKCLWELQRLTQQKRAGFYDRLDLHEKIRLLGQTYAAGQVAYETSDQAKQEIIEINRQIYDQDKKILSLWQLTRQWSLDYFNQVYQRVYVKFDRCYFESEFAKRGLDIAAALLKQGILEKSQGAVVFNGKKYGVDTRVFVNHLGFPTYEGKELALAEKEFSDFGEIDKCIHVVTPEQTSFFKVTFKVETLINPGKYAGKQYHLAYEWVKLKTGKMSSRTGNVIEGPWLIDEIKKKVIKKYHNDPAAAETLAVASTKYAFLKNATDKAIAFDLNESISLEGNSALYLLYTYVRTRSVLAKLTAPPRAGFPPRLAKEEQALLKWIYQYPEQVGKAAAGLAPNLVANYLFELAQQYNLFYQKHPIIKAKTERYLRIQITRAVQQIIKHGLFLLGINPVEKM